MCVCYFVCVCVRVFKFMFNVCVCVCVCQCPYSYHYFRNTCIPTYSCDCLISQLCGGSANMGQELQLMFISTIRM